MFLFYGTFFVHKCAKRLYDSGLAFHAVHVKGNERKTEYSVITYMFYHVLIFMHVKAVFRIM